ncbi:MAG: class I SAM-dependent RNA methyltransferase [Cytophagales bacterium]
MNILVKTLFGLEEILAEELRELGAENIRQTRRAVSCEGDIAFLYAANLHLRTALKILVPLYQFDASNEDELYNKVSQFDWSKYIDLSQTFAIDNTVRSSIFQHSKYVALKAKDAIADQFKNKFGKRPNVDIQNPDIQLDIYCSENHFTISIDSSGETLNRRKYRVTGHAAPLNEVLAAGMIKLSGWTADKPLIDPMCGTGTLLIEAAMLGLNIPPQWKRNYFSFMNWENFDRDLWEKIRADSEKAILKKELSIEGGDYDKKVLQKTEETIKELNLERHIKLKHSSMERNKTELKNGFVILNPPYGERLDSHDINAFYKGISDALKNNFQGFEAWVLSSNMQALKHLRLKPSKKIVLYNGSLECRFQRYELYAGSKRN